MAHYSQFFASAPGPDMPVTGNCDLDSDLWADGINNPVVPQSWVCPPSEAPWYSLDLCSHMSL